MNHRQRDERLHHADHLRVRALHDLARAREVLSLIRDIAECASLADSLPNIARLARAALAGATPPDPSFLHGEEHRGAHDEPS